MPLPSEQYAFLAHRIYKPLTDGSEIESNSLRYRVLYISPPSAVNYRGAIVQEQTTKQLIVINKGTDPVMIHDVMTDIGMGAMGSPTQWPEAAHTMREALRIAKDQHIRTSDISITGHSLGGALAQLQAALPEAAGVHCETFNAYGSQHMAKMLSRYQPLDVASAHERVVNHRMYHDPVSALATSIGRTVEYMDHRDYQNHMQGRFSPIGEANAFAASHGIGNFWDAERNQPGAVFAHNYMHDLQHRPLDDLPRGVPLDLSAPWQLLGGREQAPAAPPAMPPPAPVAAQDPYDPRQLGVEKFALYSALKERIPDAGPMRLMQFTAACHENCITAKNLDMIHLNEDRMTIEFHGKSWLSTPAVIDLNQPPPEIGQSLQQIREVDQVDLNIERGLAQSAQLSQQGPVL
jgi:dienelactone hydrolase